MVKNVTLREAWSGEADCLNCQLRQSVLFSGLEEEDFKLIHDPIDQFVLSPGATLYRVGDMGEYMYTIRSGLLKLMQYLPDGSQRIVRLVRTTDVVGLESLVSDTYHHDAIALHTTELCRFPAKLVREMGRHNPKLHHELMQRWQHALSEADAWLTELCTGSAKQRIARLLQRLAKDSEDGACELFSREDIGSMLGITTETSSRTIADFKRRSLIIETQPNRFLLDLPNLERIADDG